MSFYQYSCGRCGRPTSRSDSRCPHCGVAFSGINCRSCGYTGASSEFSNDVCPKCGRNPVTGRKPQGEPKPMTPKDKAFAAGCVAVLGVLLIALGLLAGMATGCRGVSIVLGTVFLLLTIPLTLDIYKVEKEPESGTLPEKKPESGTPPMKKPMPVPAPFLGPCPFPQFPLSGWKDPVSGGFFVPHPMSWNAGVRSAREGLTGFIMSGDMYGRFYYAHFTRKGSTWEVMIDDYLP